MTSVVRAWHAFWPPLTVVLASLVLWQLLVMGFDIPIYILPTPLQVVEVFFEYPDRLLAATWRTAWATLVGFGITATLGVFIGSLLSLVPFARRGVYPLTLLLQMVPLVAIAPMLVIWFGYGSPSVIVSAVIVSIFPVIAGTLDGLQSVDPGLRELFRIQGTGRLRTWWLLGLPWSLPSIFTGLRIAAGLAVIGAIVGEFVGAYGGEQAPLGAIITSAMKQGETRTIFAAISLASLLGFLLFGLVNLASRVLLRRWHASGS
ncbi:MAG: ABC transporter permease [Phycisphaerales bacterium]|nr:ABC transporter permease [Phycisphaerales bacterium]